ncbi:MAG: single-stranded-DNA-specific exonuclease RecJ [Pseudomonadota bacterium]
MPASVRSYEERSVPDRLQSWPGVPDLLRRIYAARGVASEQELDLSLTKLLSPNLLLNADYAAARLADAIRGQERILIVGDFDADGATSTVLVAGALGDFGAEHVDYLVPNRFEYGYGLTTKIVELARSKSPDLIITVDNGISSIEGVALAKRYGIDVLITDHHLPGEQLPAADVIVNPNQPGCTFPSKNLAGVGVAFYLMLALRSFLRELGYFEEKGYAEPKLVNYLDLVALGTVADVVPLDHNNRILVAAGIRRIRQGLACLGLSELLRIGKRESERVVASDLGFSAGPRLNAAGRLDDMTVGIECLRAQSSSRAAALAAQLDSMNRERQRIERSMQQDAEELMAGIEDTLDTGSAPSALVLFEPHWHQGVVGILASRVKDQMNLPVFAFACADDGFLKGSGRSVPGLHLRDTLELVAREHPGVLQKFGGHAMAAGVSIAEEHLVAFGAAFEQAVRRQRPAAIDSVVVTDGVLPTELLDLNTARQLREGGPWGQEFSEPLFVGEFELIDHKLVGERHLKLSVRHPETPRTLDAIAFSVDTQQWPRSDVKGVRMVYRLDVNQFRGVERLQLIAEYLEPL